MTQEELDYELGYWNGQIDALKLHTEDREAMLGRAEANLSLAEEMKSDG